MNIPESWIKLSPKTKNIGYLLNLDSAVGENCANRADDVMLVQYILMTTLAAPKVRPLRAARRKPTSSRWPTRALRP